MESPTCFYLNDVIVASGARYAEKKKERNEAKTYHNQSRPPILQLPRLRNIQDPSRMRLRRSKLPRNNGRERLAGQERLQEVRDGAAVCLKHDDFLAPANQRRKVGRNAGIREEIFQSL